MTLTDKEKGLFKFLYINLAFSVIPFVVFNIFPVTLIGVIPIIYGGYLVTMEET
jgi:hypothetical protein